MPWARLDDNYFTHHKIAELSKDAKLLDLAAIAFSAREMRDGDLTRADIRVIAAQVDIDDPFTVATQLVTAGRWGRAERGFVIHDYLKYNPSREQVLQSVAMQHEHRHLRRARERQAVGHFTAAEWRALCEAYGGRCLACGQTVPLTVDHVVPLARGGTNDIGNVQPLCRPDNVRKGTRTIDYRPRRIG